MDANKQHKRRPLVVTAMLRAQSKAKSYTFRIYLCCSAKSSIQIIFSSAESVLDHRLKIIYMENKRTETNDIDGLAV